MYKNISNIRWDYDNETSVAGSVLLKKKKDIVHFDLDPAKQSDFKITNYFWDLMED